MRWNVTGSEEVGHKMTYRGKKKTAHRREQCDRSYRRKFDTFRISQPTRERRVNFVRAIRDTANLSPPAERNGYEITRSIHAFVRPYADRKVLEIITGIPSSELGTRAIVLQWFAL